MPKSSLPTIDSFDRKILNLVQVSNRITSDKIAEQVGLSPAAVQRRLKRMRTDKVIEADVSVVNPKVVGHAMTFVVQVTLERERVDLMHIFKKDMQANPAVQQCYYVMGSSDFILIVTARDMEGYDTFTRETFFDNANIKSFQTNVVMDAVKVGLALDIEEDAEE
ncbi:ArsR family transcriptional regulator [Veronia nyctiphanis]|uniref:ArsR family transcriptional regulator n=1 Tax=Veronia nyctiphanis TaxID=1278244 RepID=A0A4V1LS89_9GAMM|nr:Lrp/AsnC family transcriptional regulator [Veronia nyctiphanis]RXJ70858.1 ArsR family transcriptional regulator [Veronia nyctiphanis]